jgi:hypothetical protein
MKARATWWATAVGTAVGTGGWLMGLGHVIWPEHPMWALFFATVVSTIATQVIVDQTLKARVARLRSPGGDPVGHHPDRP